MSPVSRLLAALRTESPSLLVVGRLIATMLAFVTAPIVARAIGPEGRGETAAAIALFSIVPIVLAIGVPLEVRRLSAVGQGVSALRAARVYTLAAFPFSICAGALGYISLFAEFEQSTRIVAAVGVALCPMMVSWTCDLSLLIGVGRFRGVMALQVVQPLAYLSLLMVFLLGGALSTTTVLIANIAGTSAAFVTGALLSKISLRGERYSLRLLIGGGIRFAGSSIAEAASSRLDQVIALPLVGAFQAGLYSVAVTIASIPVVIGQALGAIYFPVIARANQSERQQHKEEALRVAIAGAILCLPLIVVAAWIGIPLLFGSGFAGAVPVTWISGIGSCALIVSYVSSMALAAEGRGYRMTISQIASLAVAIVLLFLIAPPLGAIGAAAASSTGYLILMAILVLSLGVRARHGIVGLTDFRLVFVRVVKGR